MPFKKGNKHGKGGRRPNAGRPSKQQREIKRQAEEIAREFIEGNIEKILGTYLKNAVGHMETRYTDDGREYEVWVVDAATTRHAIDKFVPPAKQTIEHDVNVGITVVEK